MHRDEIYALQRVLLQDDALVHPQARLQIRRQGAQAAYEVGLALKPLHLEVWSSSENRQERHYFMRDGEMHGYQRGQRNALGYAREGVRVTG